MPDADSQQQIGRLAVERGLLTTSQLREALEEYETRRAAGSRLPLGGLLVELELLTRKQLEGLLSAQGGKKGPRQQIAGFELIKKLGEGGMGATYLARQTSMDRLVALKVLRKNLARNSDFVARFQREAQLGGKLDHVNIVGVISVGEGGGYHYLAMEYVEGRDAFELMPDRGGMDEELALHITMQVTRALDFAHKAGIIHRDIKPDNILVTEDNVAKVCDFGLARQTGDESRLTQTGVAMGTPYYISPEQARGDKDADIRSDIYSLGATLYHLVTGHTSFEGSSAAVVMTKHLTEQVPWPADVNPEVSENVCRVIQRMMAKDPDDRYADPAALIADLELVIDGKPPASAVMEASRSLIGQSGLVQVRPMPVRRRKRYQSTAGTDRTRPVEPVEARRLPTPVLVGIGAGILLLFAVGLWALMRPDDDEKPKPPPKVVDPVKPPEKPPEDEKRFEEMYKYAQECWKKNPEDYAGAIAKFQKVAGSPQAGVWGMRAEDTIMEIRKASEKAVEAAFSALKENAGKLAETGDFDGAIAALSKPPEKFAGLLAERVKQEQEALKAEAEKKLGAAIDAAEKLSADGEPEKGLAELEKAKSVKYAAWDGKLVALRTRLEKEKLDVAALAGKRREAKARKFLAAVLDRFDELMLAGRYKDAGEHVAAERKKIGRALRKLMPPGLAEAEKVASKLVAHGASRAKALKRLKGKKVELRKRVGAPTRGTVEEVTADAFKVKVTFRIGGTEGSTTRTVKFADLAKGELERLLPGFKPTGTDGQIAAVLLAMGGKDYPAAEKALKAAGEHPLVARYREKLEVMVQGAGNVAARKAWEKDIAPLVRDKYAAEAARKLIAVLDAYTAAHGGTDFAKGRKPEVDRLYGLARTAIEASPEEMLAKVKKLFHGKVVKFDPKTLRVELLYDFEDKKQLQDWKLSEWAWRGKTGGSVKVEKGVLHMLRTGRYILLRGKYTSVSARVDFAVAGGRDAAALLVCADGSGNFFHLFGIEGGKRAYRARCVAGKLSGALPPVKSSPFATAKSGWISLRYGNSHLKGRVGALAFEGDDNAHSCGQVGFLAPDTDASFDNLRIVGQLDRAWLEKALTPPPPSAFRASWQQLKLAGEKPKATAYMTCAMTYDSKRKRCVMFGGYPKRNELSALDLSNMRWTCLQKNDPKGPGVGKTRPGSFRLHHFVYEDARDRYWVNYSWSYAPAEGRWAKLTELPKGCRLPGVRYGWAHDPDGRRFMSIYPNLMQCWFVYPKKNRAEALPRRPGQSRSFLDGGLAYDRKNKVFVLFGGSGGKPTKYFNDTWTFNPRTKEWRQMRPKVSPPGRAFHKLVWHDKLGALVMAGGLTKKGRVNDLWVYDLWVYETAADRWTEIKTPTAPPPAYQAAAYDAAHDRLVLFNRKGQTWICKIERVKKK